MSLKGGCDVVGSQQQLDFCISQLGAALGHTQEPATVQPAEHIDEVVLDSVQRLLFANIAVLLGNLGGRGGGRLVEEGRENVK